MRKSLFALTWMTTAALSAVTDAQSTTTYEDGPDGVKYAVTRQVVQRSIPTTEIQTRQQQVYRPQVTTEYQTYQQTYLTPVTRYQYVPHLRNWWNPITGAYWTHDLQPVTQWEARPATVQVPVAQHELGGGNSNDTGAGDDVSDRSGRIYKPGARERRPFEYESRTAGHSRNDSCQFAD